MLNEQFETRPLLDLDSLRALQTRKNLPSLIRLVLHVVSFAALFVLVAAGALPVPLMLLASVALAWVWSGLFAPYHECTHGTAFTTPRANAIGAWLTGLPFLMAPAVYRPFHFEHHRHTQDAEKDPEIAGDPRYLHWPTGWRGWLTMATGTGLIMLKLRPLLGFALRPESDWQQFAPWQAHIRDRRGIVRECRLVLAVWGLFVVACIAWWPGGGWLLFAAWFAHVFQTLWIATEHIGLPVDGNILQRTRSVRSNRFVRWWIWNMNYHAEHHAWPGIPWHQLPATHALVRDQLASCVAGYSDLHRNIIAARNPPRCDP